MKKNAFLFLLLFLANTLMAQSEAKFNLKPNGTFISDDGNSYLIIEYNGKNAQELYSMVKSNVITLYKSPKDVMSENEPNNLSIRALTDYFYNSYQLGGGFVSYRAYYNLVFHFKDGKIKVDAPVVDRQLDISATGAPLPKSFVGLVDGWFDKKGNVKKKKKDSVERIETIFNYTINYLLGNNQQMSPDENEDW